MFLVLQRRFGFDRRIRKPIHIAQLEAPRAVHVILQGGLREGGEGHGSNQCIGAIIAFLMFLSGISPVIINFYITDIRLTMYRHNYLNFLVLVRVFLLLSLPLWACSQPFIEIDPTNIAPQDLSGRDFSFTDLVSADLSGKNLQDSNFTSANLVLANLKGADLRRAILISAYLREADFTGADLRGATLDYPSIQKTNFTNADLRESELKRVCFSDAIWTGAKLDTKWQGILELVLMGIQVGQDLRGYDMSYTCFDDYDLRMVNLQGVNLMGSTFYNVNFEQANLSESNLQNVSFLKADLRNADLRGANLEGADLTYAILTGAYVTEEQLQKAKRSCTRMPDGTIFAENECSGTIPAP